MPGLKPTAINLTVGQRSILEQLTRRSTSPQRLVWRAKSILLADEGQDNTMIAHQLFLARYTVRQWRQRWAAAADAINAAENEDAKDNRLTDVILSVLDDNPRTGAPSTFTPEQIVHVVAMACTSPEAYGRPISHWSHRELADEMVKRQIVSSISPRSVGRFLKRGGFTTP